jgi:chromosome partitioning protein
MGKALETAKTLAIANRKGGCGKTMTAVSFGISEPDKLTATLATAMTHIANEADFNSLAGVIHNTEGADVMPANSNLAALEISLAGIIRREAVLRQYIDKVKTFYDYIIIDTAPTLDLLTINALAATDSVIISVAPKYLDALGLGLLLKSVAQIRRIVVVPSMNDFEQRATPLIQNCNLDSFGAKRAFATERNRHNNNYAYSALVGEVLENG